MTWTATASETSLIVAGDVTTVTVFQNDQGKGFKDNVRYDGTLQGWQNACAAKVLKADAQGKPVFVAPGTSFTIPDPVAPVDPTPLPPEVVKWQTLFAAYRQLAIWLAQGYPIAGLSDRVAQANADQQKAWDPSFDAFL